MTRREDVRGWWLFHRRVEEERLADLRERYAVGQFDLARLEVHIGQVLAGKQPTWEGLPFSPDPALSLPAPAGPSPRLNAGLGFLEAAISPFPEPIMEATLR